MPTESDIELDFDAQKTIYFPVNMFLRFTVPKLTIIASPPVGPLATTHTNRFAHADLPGQSTIELCLNRQEASEQMIVRCQWQPAMATVGVYDIQISLDPLLFDDPKHRVPWVAGKKRIEVSEGFCNFYSSRLAGHSNEPVKGPEFDFAIPRDVIKSLYFDFECPTTSKDGDGVPVPSELRPRSAAEWNLRQLQVYVRVLIMEQISGATLVLPSDLEAFTTAVLLGFFDISGPPDGESGGPRVANVPVHDDKHNSAIVTRKRMSFEPEAVVIHVWVVPSFNGKRPHFSKSEGLSAHYAVDGDGRIWWFVDERNVAKHAGSVTHDVTTAWGSYKKTGTALGGKWVLDEKHGWLSGDLTPNHDTIGIEHEGNSDTPWPVRKYVATGWLLQDIYSRWSKVDLNSQRIVRHNAFNKGKACPGIKIDMSHLCKVAVGYRRRRRNDTIEVLLGSLMPTYEYEFLPDGAIRHR
ncbi:MAG: peptidoglycan recognition family protein [Byssovorax sp.]